MDAASRATKIVTHLPTTIAEAQADGWTHLEFRCLNCGGVTDYPFLMILRKKPKATLLKDLVVKERVCNCSDPKLERRLWKQDLAQGVGLGQEMPRGPVIE